MVDFLGEEDCGNGGGGKGCGGGGGGGVKRCSEVLSRPDSSKAGEAAKFGEKGNELGLGTSRDKSGLGAEKLRAEDEAATKGGNPLGRAEEQ